MFSSMGECLLRNIFCHTEMVKSFDFCCSAFLTAVVSMASNAYIVHLYEYDDISAPDSNRSATKWLEVSVGLATVWYTAFTTVWLLAIIIACVSFCYRNPITLMPNIIVLVFGIFLDLLILGVSLGFIFDLESSKRTKTSGRITLIYHMGLMGFVGCVMLLSVLVLLWCKNTLNEVYDQEHSIPAKRERNESLQTFPPPNPNPSTINNPYVVTQQPFTQQVPQSFAPQAVPNVHNVTELNRFYESEIINKT